MSAKYSFVALLAHILLWQTCAGLPPEFETPVVFKITELSETCKSENWTSKLQIHSECINCNVKASVQRCDFPDSPERRSFEHNILCRLSPDTIDATDFVLNCGEKFNKVCEAKCVLSYRQEIQLGSVYSTLESVTRIAVGVLSICLFIFVFYMLKRIRDQRRQGRQPLSQEDV